MTEVEQQKLHDPPEQQGDCMRAAWASVLERPIEELPSWEEHALTVWWANWVHWFALQGYGIMIYAKAPAPSNTPLDSYVAVGDSPRHDDVKHCVVHTFEGREWDPHPSKDGLNGDPDQYEWLVPHSFQVERGERLWSTRREDGTIEPAPRY